MNYVSSQNKIVAIVTILACSTTFIAWNYTDRSKPQKTNTTASSQDTVKPRKQLVPKDEYRITDPDTPTQEMDTAIKQALARINEIDFDKISKEVDAALKKADWYKIKPEVRKALKEAQSEVKKIHIEELKNQLEKVKVELQNLKPAIRLNAEEIRQQVEQSINKAKERPEN